MLRRLATLPRKIKILVVLISDLVLLPIALWSSIALRFGSMSPDVAGYWWIFVLLPVLTIPILIRTGLYRAVIRFMDDRIIMTVVYGMSLSALMLAAIVFMGRVVGLPRSSIGIYWVTGIAYILSSRFIARGLMRSLDLRDERKQKVAIYGAGRAGLQTALALHSSPEYKPIAFFDDNSELHGTMLAGIQVYDPKDILSVLADTSCNQILFAIPSASRTRRKEIIESIEGHGIYLKTLPSMGELVSGAVRVEDIREVGIEDLLGRDSVPPIQGLISACIRGKVVMVTGAGGSIGSDICRQVLMNDPAKLVIFEYNEFALYKIDQELRRFYPRADIVTVLGDVMNQTYLESLMAKYKVETVYHAAAYKHVPLVEANITMGVLNNVFGTYSAAQAALNQKVSSFVLISTDKAVRPTNVMGATKRLAELVLQALSRQNSKTRFCMVRFGNVLGSSGSVVPLFREQIRNGGPVTVTHPEVTRYFMTIPEAVNLVLQAGAMGSGGEVFVLEMGEPVKIMDLAAKMIELSGLEVKTPENPNGDIAIEITGLRPGEKLYEELLIGNNVSGTEHPRIMKAQEAMIEPAVLLPLLDKLLDACNENQADKIKGMLKELVKEYVASAESTVSESQRTHH